MRSLCLVGLLLVGQAVCRPATAQTSGEEETLRRRRMELLESVAANSEVRKNEEGVEPLARSKAPILRWSNPVRDFVNDGLGGYCAAASMQAAGLRFGFANSNP